MCGAIGELVYKTGDVKLHELSSLTSRVIKGEGNNGK